MSAATQQLSGWRPVACSRSGLGMHDQVIHMAQNLVALLAKASWLNPLF